MNRKTLITLKTVTWIKRVPHPSNAFCRLGGIPDTNRLAFHSL
jgi:hypothetical protein